MAATLNIAQVLIQTADHHSGATVPLPQRVSSRLHSGHRKLATGALELLHEPARHHVGDAHEVHG